MIIDQKNYELFSQGLNYRPIISYINESTIKDTVKLGSVIDFYLIFNNHLSNIPKLIYFEGILVDYSPDITPDFLTVLLRASPYIILFIILPFITLIVILKYSLKILKPISYYNDSIKVTSNPLSYESEDRHVNKVIPTSVLEEFWFCQTDKSRLQQHVQKMLQSPFFNVLRNNIEIGIKNAIQMKKIFKETERQTFQLVTKLFNEYPLEELSLVSTQCPDCLKYYSCPQIY